jgi:hypothetical protein
MGDSKKLIPLYFYEVGYNSEEGSSSTSLVSDQEVSQDDFEKLCIEACNAALKNLLGANKNHLGYYDKLDEKAYISFEYLVDGMVEELAKKGFNRVTFKANFFPFGWGNLFDREDWKDHRDDLDYRLIDGLDKEVIEKITQKMKAKFIKEEDKDNEYTNT